jgi:putative transposase
MSINRTAYNKALCKWESGLAGIGNLWSSFGFKEIEHDIRVSMDGKGRAMDNERLSRSVKYEEIYLKDYARVRELKQSLKRYFSFYNAECPHLSFDVSTPGEACSWVKK